MKTIDELSKGKLKDAAQQIPEKTRQTVDFKGRMVEENSKKPKQSFRVLREMRIFKINNDAKMQKITPKSCLFVIFYAIDIAIQIFGSMSGNFKVPKASA